MHRAVSGSVRFLARRGAVSARVLAWVPSDAGRRPLRCCLAIGVGPVSGRYVRSCCFGFRAVVGLECGLAVTFCSPDEHLVDEVMALGAFDEVCDVGELLLAEALEGEWGEGAHGECGV